MSGHSKWANIKHKKAKTDAQKGKTFTKLGRELIVAARAGGADPANNFRLFTRAKNLVRQDATQSHFGSTGIENHGWRRAAARA